MNFLRRDDVERRTGLRRSSLYHLVKRGHFPAPVKISKGAVAWPEHEVEAWMKDRLAERDGEAA